MAQTVRLICWLLVAILAAGVLTPDLEAAATTAPALTFSTYFGSQEDEFGWALAGNYFGELHTIGQTWAFLGGFPLLNAPPPLHSYFWFRSDVFLTKITTDPPLLRSSALLGYFGAVSNADVTTYGDFVYVVGSGFDTEVADAFLVRTSIWGGPFELLRLPFRSPFPIEPLEVHFSPASASAVTTDKLGNIYVAGELHYTERFEDRPSQPHDLVMVAKLDSNLNLVYLSSVDASRSFDQRATDIVVDEEGNAYVSGFTSANDLPTTPGAFQGSRTGGEDGFVLKLGPTGDVESLTYLGGSGNDRALGITLDEAGRPVVTGQTSSSDFPVRDAFQPSLRGASDAFVTQLTADGSGLVFSTYLGGSGEDSAAAIDTMPGRFVLAGKTSSADFPLVSPIPRPCEGGSPRLCGPSDAFVTALHSDGSTLVFSTFYGGSGEDWAEDLTVTPLGDVAITGTTGSPDLPLVNPIQSALAGKLDAFIARIQLPNQAPNCAAALATPSVIWPPNGRLVPVSITGVSDPEGDAVTLTITGITQDEPLSGRGSDASGIGTPNAQVRADRRGNGDGRVYTLAFEARDELGAACAGGVTVCVPHDRRPGAGCGDSGARYSSTGN